MNILFKSVFAVIWLVIWYVLISLTFMFGESWEDPSDISFSYYSSWVYDITNKLEWTNLEYNKLYVEYLSSLDSLYYDKENNYEMQETENKNEYKIVLNTWLFFFDLNDITKKYSISFKWFTINPISNWKFFVDTRDDKKIHLLSWTSVLETNFYKYETSDILNRIYTFPHQIIRFSIENDIQKGYISDFYQEKLHFTRINDLTWNLYVIESFSSISKSDKINNILWRYWQDFLATVYNYIDKNYKKNLDTENIIINLSFVKFPFQNYIEKYFNYFINWKKKSVYLTNSVFADLKTLLESNKKEPWLVIKIKNSLVNLKSLNIEWYEKVIKTINWYYVTFVMSSNIDNKFIIYNLYSLLNWWSLKNFDIFYDMNSFYTLYDLNLIWDLTDNLNKFTSDFFQLLWVDVNSSANIKFESLNDEIIVNYLLLYLKLYLEDVLSEYKDKQLYNNKVLLNSYFLIISKFLNDDNIVDKDKRELHWLNFDLLSTIETYLLYTFFNKDEENEWYLTINGNTEIDKEFLWKLWDNIDKMYWLYSRDKYFIASSFSYKKTLDSIKRYLDILLWKQEEGSIDNGGITQVEPTQLIKISDVEKYLSSFDLVRPIKITIMDDHFFVEKFLVWDKELSFEINPYFWNNMSNITVNWEPIWSTYKLDQVEKKMWGDFKNFFKKTFLDLEE